MKMAAPVSVCGFFLGLRSWTFPFTSVARSKLLARGKGGDDSSFRGAIFLAQRGKSSSRETGLELLLLLSNLRDWLLVHRHGKGRKSGVSEGDWGLFHLRRPVFS